MILIRGIKGKEYAKKIEKGIVDCRDLLSSLLNPPITGYTYSDYYERNLVYALKFFCHGNDSNIYDPFFLYSLLSDYYIPHIYLTYFHILNENSLEWLNEFDDDYDFITLNVKIDKNTQTAIGNEFFGKKMMYVDNIKELSQDCFQDFHVACMCSIERLFSDKMDMEEPISIYNTIFFPLLCRERDERFSDIENEFRIIAYDCPRILNGKRIQNPRNAILQGASGIKYFGTLKAGENALFKSDCCLLRNHFIPLNEILTREKGNIKIDSKFKSININDISDNYRYLGGKQNCEKYIKKMLKSKPKDIYVNRTIKKRYKWSDIGEAVFISGYQKVDY